MAEINPTQLRSAVAWGTNAPVSQEDDDKSPWEWFWEAIQGDFNENRSTGQIVADAAISMIPLVDQVGDVRDLIANCKKLREDAEDTWAWVALGLTLIGLLPFLGSLIKGVLKIFFSFIRRATKKAFSGTVDGALNCVVTLLRREECQRYLRRHKVDEVFGWLAKKIKEVKAKTNPAALLRAFDKGIQTTKALVAKVDHVPVVGAKAKTAFDKIVWVRARSDDGMKKACGVIDEIFDAIIARLERESLKNLHGIVNVKNVHYRGALPESAAITLMRTTDPKPSWLNTGDTPAVTAQIEKDQRSIVDAEVVNGWPDLTGRNIESFHTMINVEIKGPARLYRILSPNSRAMSDCWVSEKVFNDIQNSPDPRATWRKFLAVWPDWNVNGQFVIYDVKPGETLKVWKGPASGQVKEDMPGFHLEGGWEQIILKIERSDIRNDSTRFYKIEGSQRDSLGAPINFPEYNKLTQMRKDEYLEIRESINHPSISGPFETGWGYTDFDGDGFSEKIGLPSLSGQVTKLNN